MHFTTFSHPKSMLLPSQFLCGNGHSKEIRNGTQTKNANLLFLLLLSTKSSSFFCHKIVKDEMLMFALVPHFLIACTTKTFSLLNFRSVNITEQQKQWLQINWAAKGLRIYFNMLPTQLIGIPGAKRLSKQLKKATS